MLRCMHATQHAGVLTDNQVQELRDLSLESEALRGHFVLSEGYISGAISGGGWYTHEVVQVKGREGRVVRVEKLQSVAWRTGLCRRAFSGFVLEASVWYRIRTRLERVRTCAEPSSTCLIQPRPNNTARKK